MNIDWSFGVSSFASIIAILNPVGALPVYVALVSDETPAATRRIARMSTLAVGATMVSFFLFGPNILSFFSISIPAFRAAGGILILLMAISMLQGRMSDVKHTAEETEAISGSGGGSSDTFAVVPIGIPILAGPGTMSTLILLGEKAGPAFSRQAPLATAILIATALTYLTLAAGNHVHRLMGETGIRIATRIMGLVNAAVAVQFIADGMRELFPGLA